jgi:hypothetical protein
MHTTGPSAYPSHRHYDDFVDPWRNIGIETIAPIMHRCACGHGGP